VSGCTGHCCNVFTLPYTPEELQARAWNIHEGAYIAAMVEPLTLDAAAERAGNSKWAGFDGSLYTCRFWDERTRKCLQYANRPWMCSAYPYRRKCTHCGWHGGESTKARAKVVMP
jgi:Fe-S-cluster containining protein